MTKRVLWSLIVLLLWAMPVLGQDNDEAYVDNAYQEALRRIEEARVSGATELKLSDIWLETLPPEIGQLTSLQKLRIDDTHLDSLPPEIGQLTNLRELLVFHTWLKSLPPEIGQLSNLNTLILWNTGITALPVEMGQLSQLTYLQIDPLPETFPPSEITSQGIPATLAYLRDYEAMQARQTIAGIAAGVGGIAGVLLAFRWRQRRGLHEKKKRL